MPARTARLNRMIGYGFWRLNYIAIFCFAVTTGAFAEEDPYLSAISIEAAKVETTAQPTLDKPDAQPAGEDGLNMQSFEEDLKARYKGSYTFYEKLPRRTREEVFLEYRDGASIDEIRKKIMDRFLHQ